MVATRGACHHQRLQVRQELFSASYTKNPLLLLYLLSLLMDKNACSSWVFDLCFERIFTLAMPACTRREHYPVRKLSDFMARRAEYIRIYKAYRSMHRGFVSRTLMPRFELIAKSEPAMPPVFPAAAAPTAAAASAPAAAAATGASRLSRSSGDAAFGAGTQADTAAQQSPLPRKRLPLQVRMYQRKNSDPATAKALHTQLLQLESQLTLGQIMCYRTFVALWHSQYLARNPDIKDRWESAMSVITNFVDAIPTMEEEVDQEAIDAQEEDGGASEKAAASIISVRIFCPRVGLKVVNRHVATAPASAVGVGTGWSAAMAAEEAARKHQRRTADVMLIVLEGLHFHMPTMHHMSTEVRLGHCCGHGN